MTDHFNGLSPAEAERLAMLAEEAGEVIQAIGKVLRHGYASTHPDGGADNRAQLHREVLDFTTVAQAMVAAGDLTQLAKTPDIWRKKLRYSHHQKARGHD